MQNQKILRVNISPHLIIINLQMKYFMQRWKNKKLVDESDISEFINNNDLDKKKKKLASKAELKAEQGKRVKLKICD